MIKTKANFFDNSLIWLSDKRSQRYLKIVWLLLFSAVVWLFVQLYQGFSIHSKAISVNPVLSLTTISDAHIFGIAPNTVDYYLLPITNLPINLIGTNVAYNKSQSSAIITMAGQQQVFAIGDSVDGASIVAILPNRVVLNHAGKLEALVIPEETLTFGQAPASLNLPIK